MDKIVKMSGEELAEKCNELQEKYDKLNELIKYLLKQIDIADFKDEHGHNLKMNKYYIECIKEIVTKEQFESSTYKVD